MAEETSGRVVERYWQAMNTNDWVATSALLHDDFALDYPQSGERFRGRENFVALNGDYPVAGPWRFSVQRIVAGEQQAVSDVTVTAPSVTARVIAFFELRDGMIWRMTEYWPDPFEAAAWRAPLAEPITPQSDVSEE